MIQYLKNCEVGIKFLVLKFSHDQFNWSQEILLTTLNLLDFDPYIDLENNRIDAILSFNNKIVYLEHKFIGLLSKRENNLNEIIKKVQTQIKQKKLDIILITTLTIKYPKAEQFLFNFEVCLHVFQLNGEFMASAKANEISKKIINKFDSELEEYEELVTPLNAKMFLIMENQQKHNNKLFDELKANDEQLKANDEQLKANDEQLMADIEKLTVENAEIKKMLKQLISSLSEK